MKGETKLGYRQRRPHNLQRGRYIGSCGIMNGVGKSGRGDICLTKIEDAVEEIKGSYMRAKSGCENDADLLAGDILDAAVSKGRRGSNNGHLAQLIRPPQFFE